jgi:hypothetical protein
MGNSLRATEPSIRRSDGPCDGEYLAAAFEHDESSILIRQPTQGSERNHSIRTDHDQPFQSVTHARESGLSPISANAVFNNQMTAIDAHLDAVPEKGHNTSTRYE